MSSPAIVIISKDKDFAQPVAEQIKSELGKTCHIAADAQEAKDVMSGASLIVASESGKFERPAIIVGKPPFHLPQLIADIAAALRKQGNDTMDLTRGYALQSQRKRLTYNEASIDLTDKEAQLLQCLLEAGSAGISKEELLKQVWGIASALDTHTLETHIYRLRGKFRELSGDDALIAAFDGGYKLEK